MLILGLGHKARHGKNYLAKTLVQHCAKRGIYAQEYAFADAVKAYCRVAFGMREKDATLLQFVGTDVFRKHQPDIWVRVLADTLHEQRPEVAIITDLRFPNEMQMIKDRAGYTVRVTRTQADGSPWVAPDRDPNHLSETALDHSHFDFELTAVSGNLVSLYQDGIQLFDQLWSVYAVAYAAAPAGGMER